MAEAPTQMTPSAHPASGDDERASLLRVLRTQVRARRYHAEPEHVAEQLLAWHSPVQR